MPKTGVSSALFGGKHSILSMDASDHTRARRLLSHAMSDRAIKEQQPLIQGYVDTMIGKIRDVAMMANGSKVDLVKLYNFTTFDVMADLSFGEPLGMLAKDEWSPWMKAIGAGFPVVIKLAVLEQWFPYLRKVLVLLLPASAKDAIRTHVSYSKSQVDKRLANPTERPDFWTYILRNQGKEEGELSTIENHAMGMTLMIAGSETTATSVSGLTKLLLSNPSSYERLTAEIRAAFPSTDNMDMDKLASLPYLQCCVKEALRLYPPVPMGGRARRVPAGGRYVGDHFVPEGALINVSHYGAFQTAINWHRPREFIPERWLPENQTSGPFANDKREILQPFSFGPRNCIGKNLAYHETRLLVASVLWHFDLELCPESEDWFNQSAYVVLMKPPLMVVPRLAQQNEK